MRISLASYVRSRSLFSSLFGKSKSATDAEVMKLDKQQQEKLRSILPKVSSDGPKTKKKVDAGNYDTDDILGYRIDTDSIRARGFLKYRYNYKPPSNVREIVLSIAKDLLPMQAEGTSQLAQTVFDNNDLKAKVILALADKFKHCPTNSRLLYLKSVQDVIDFYEEPVENITNYAKLSRTQSKPANIHMIEQASRFHPEDVEAWHGGVTAFPGTGGKVLGLRNKRILRQFKPKSDWFDYEDQSFDYNPPEKDMPWDSEIARRMDRYPDRRYDIKKKLFLRST